jgi:hypothetical protein
MPGNWPLPPVASIPPLLTPAWTDLPRPLAHPRKNPLSQVSHLSQMNQNKLWRKQPRQNPLSQLSRLLHRLPTLKITHLSILPNHPLPVTKALSAPPPQKPPTHLSQASHRPANPHLMRPTTLHNQLSPTSKLMHVPSLQNPLSQPSQVSHPAPRYKRRLLQARSLPVGAGVV